MGVGPRRRAIQSILSALPNGDWKLRDRVQVFVQPGIPWDRRTVALVVAKGLCMSLAGAHFRIFNRNRWTQNDYAIGQLGLLESCHGLLSRVYSRWLSQGGHHNDMGGGSAASGLASCAVDPPGRPAVDCRAIADVGEAPGAVAGGDAEMHEGDAPADAPACNAAGEGLAAAPARPGDGDQAHAEQNARNRAIAASWVGSGTVLRDLVLLRTAMEPSMVVLRKQLHIASEA